MFILFDSFNRPVLKMIVDVGFFIAWLLYGLLVDAEEPEQFEYMVVIESRVQPEHLPVEIPVFFCYNDPILSILVFFMIIVAVVDDGVG